MVLLLRQGEEECGRLVQTMPKKLFDVNRNSFARSPVPPPNLLCFYDSRVMYVSGVRPYRGVKYKFYIFKEA